MSWRTKPLQIAGASLPVALWARYKCRPPGVEFSRRNGAVELSRGEQVVRLASKHAFFAPEVAAHFDAFAGAVDRKGRRGEAAVTDFSADPDAFNLCRQCLAFGARLERGVEMVKVRQGHRVIVLAARHFVYAADVAQRFELYFAPLFPERQGEDEVLDFSQPGRLQTYRKSGLQFAMSSFPEEEDAIEEYFRWYRPSPGDLVFDAGAHCGVSTYRFAQMVGPTGKVIAFEPDPENYKLLVQNIERHGLGNVTAIQAAIAGEGGRLRFNSEGTIGSALVSELRRESIGSIVEVEAITLGDAFERWGVPRFCKIDIEGAEIEVVRRSAEVLRGKQIQFAIDTNHPQANGRLTDGEIEAMFRNYGYDVLSEANPLMTTWARAR